MVQQSFQGFPEASFEFLNGLAENNDKNWFDAHRDDYVAHYFDAAKDFIEAVGPRLRLLSPDVRFEPRVNGSIARINRDVRFSKDKRPYKDHLDLWFWHGDKRGWDNPGFFFRLSPETVTLGTGMLGFPKEMLDRYRAVVSDERMAAELRALVAGIEASGPYRIGGKTRTSVPRGMNANGTSGQMLLYEGLSAVLEWDNSIAREPDFVEFCMGHWARLWPVGRWVLDMIWR